MHKDFPDLPTKPVPVAKPQSRRRSVRFRILLLLLILVMVGLGAGLLIAFVMPSHSPISHMTLSAGSTAAAPAGGSTPASTVSLSTPTQKATTASTPKAGAPAATYGKPHLGGLLTDFVGKYGTPGSQGDVSGVNFWVGPDQSIVLNVSSNDQGRVTQIVVTGESSWTSLQTEQYCVQFLPTGAVRQSSSSTLLTYRSSAGTIHLALQTASSCSLMFVRS